MKTVKNIMNESAGFRYIIDNLQIMSSSGRKMLYETGISKSVEKLSKEFAGIDEVRHLLEIHPDIFKEIREKLNLLKDIHNTLSILASGPVLNDIDLFEIKQFALLNEEISALNWKLNLNCVRFENLRQIISILDPERQNIPHFYIYSAYSYELQAIRDKMKKCDLSDISGYEELRHQEQSAEENIRKELSLKLIPFTVVLQSALKTLSYLDILVAKSEQSLILGFCKPDISNDRTEYTSLFNPAIKEILAQQNKVFQPVDIELHPSPTLVTGANMGGKTVLLKTIFISQYLFQFGFYVPALSAKIVPLDEIILSHGENIPEFNGLSSFAAEMLNINKILISVKSGKKVLALIDELARTTNPDEGISIVNAMIDLLNEYKVSSVITTHYSGIQNQCRKLRVKGLMTEKIKGKIKFEDLNNYMDYSIVEQLENEVPAEGLKIAEIMGVDEELIRKAGDYFNKLNV
ncbi:MAG: DNA mismatch repair protein MutS [Saprospiraceae bacterium]|nr:DNA mismatch repair protein MutS [Saprospiraceae bacterium]